MNNPRKVILYISMSVDGYIADKNDGLDFLSMVAEEGEDYGYQQFVDSVDTILIGRKTYQKVLSMGYAYPHTNKEVYIISQTNSGPEGHFRYYNGDLKLLVDSLKAKQGKNIYCDGGARLANELLIQNLIDELIISVIPVLLGDGIRLFEDGRPTNRLELVHSKSYNKGLIQLTYRKLPIQ